MIVTVTEAVMKQRRKNIPMQLLLCMEACWLEYRLAWQEHIAVQIVTYVCCSLLFFLQRWELLVPAILLLCIAVIDSRKYCIPDVLLCGIVVSCMLMDLLTEAVINGSTFQSLLLHWLMRVCNGLAIGVPLLLFVMGMDALLQKETMGGGDIKLLFVIGFFTNGMLAYLVLYLACFIGLLWQLGLRQKYGMNLLPFGPSIALACGIIMLCDVERIDKFFSIL